MTMRRSSPNHPTDHHAVAARINRALDGTVLTDMVDAEFGATGARLDRDDHAFLLTISRGNVGYLTAGLRLWYHQQQHPPFDWRTAYAHLPHAIPDASGSVLVADTGEWMEVEAVDIPTNSGIRIAQTPTYSPQPALEFPAVSSSLPSFVCSCCRDCGCRLAVRKNGNTPNAKLPSLA
ncbi:MAG: hypothetical protein NT020_09440 [Chloroflexales bacterium]|nr:hypothetical protein [Chloroflexales bacterium]